MNFQGIPGFAGVKGEKGLPGPAGQRVSKDFQIGKKVTSEAWGKQKQFQLIDMIVAWVET